MNDLALRLAGVSYAYPDGTAALHEISFDVRPGEKLAVVGPNGAGKSTLLLLLNGVLTPSAGQVEVAGLAVNRANLRQVRRSVGLVFQDPDDQLFCPTVFEDVAFGPRNMGLNEDEVAARVQQALELVGAAGLAGRSAHHLSLGQRKRVALATVLSMRPALWAFDEPSANLDPTSQAAIERFIIDCPDTTLVVTQDLSLAAQTCARTLLLDQGQLVADGPTIEILSDAALLAQHGLDFSRYCRSCELLRGSWRPRE